MEKLQCSVCGGTLVMSDDGERAVCESCGMSFKKETVKKMIMELSGPVQVEGIQNSSSLADRAETFLRLGEVKKAEGVFRQLADEYPADYRGWWGLTRTMDWERYFYESGTGDAVMPAVCKRAFEFAPDDVKEEIRAFYETREQTLKPGTDQRLQKEAAEQAEKTAAMERERAEKDAHEQKLALYRQAVKQAERREEEARKQYSAIYNAIPWLTNEIKNEKKLTNNKATGDRRPITAKNLIALALGGMLTWAAWVEFHPIGTPVVTLLGLGLPLLFIARRVKRTISHFTRAKELEQQLKQAQQALPNAQKELDEAKAALRAIREAKPN